MSLSIHDIWLNVLPKKTVKQKTFLPILFKVYKKLIMDNRYSVHVHSPDMFTRNSLSSKIHFVIYDNMEKDFIRKTSTGEFVCKEKVYGNRVMFSKKEQAFKFLEKLQKIRP